MSTATAPNPFAGKATKAGGTFELCPAGNHPAHLILIHDLGTHDGEYKGKAKESRKLFLAWELSAEIRPNGEPFVIGREYTVLVEDDGSFLFAEDSNLRKMMEAWRGAKYGPSEPIDPMALLGRACLLNVAHKPSGDKTYANISGVSGLPKGMGAPRRMLEPIAYHVSMGTPPDASWLPWSYGQTLADVVGDSKERTGKPIGQKAKPGDTPYSSSAPRDYGPSGSDRDLPLGDDGKPIF